MDGEGEAPRRAEPPRPIPQVTALQAAGKGPALHHWCAQNEAIPGLLTLATTISRWEDEIVAASLTGVTNAISESLNRLAELEARLAHGFATPPASAAASASPAPAEPADDQAPQLAPQNEP